MMNQIPIDPRTDGISCVRFAPNSGSLLVTSWDGAASIYSTEREGNPPLRLIHVGSVLSGCFSFDGQKVYTGGLENIAREFVSSSDAAARILGRHDGPIRACNWLTSLNTLVTGSWDKSIKLFDPRQAEAEVASARLSDRLFSMDVFEHNILTATAEGSIHLYDARNFDAGAVVSRPSTIGHQIRCTRIFDKGLGAYVGSIEGRVAVENLDPSQPLAKRYAFKCHRVDETVYPVNAIAVQSVNGNHTSLFATGGGDENVSLWDVVQKKRVYQCPKLETSCSYLDFSPDGNLLAIASSYCFERGDIAHPADSLLVLDVAGALEAQPS